MIGKQITTERDVPLSEVKKILSKRKDEGELSYEQKAALEYADEFAGAATKNAALVEELVKISKIDEALAVQICDNKPRDKEDLRVLMEKKRFDLSDAEIKKVLDLVAEHSK
jgi:DNA-directed RNA polymerase subunit F